MFWLENTYRCFIHYKLSISCACIFSTSICIVSYRLILSESSSLQSRLSLMYVASYKPQCYHFKNRAAVLVTDSALSISLKGSLMWYIAERSPCNFHAVYKSVHFESIILMANLMWIYGFIRTTLGADHSERMKLNQMQWRSLVGQQQGLVL